MERDCETRIQGMELKLLCGSEAGVCMCVCVCISPSDHQVRRPPLTPLYPPTLALWMGEEGREVRGAHITYPGQSSHTLVLSLPSILLRICIFHKPTFWKKKKAYTFFLMQLKECIIFSVDEGN